MQVSSLLFNVVKRIFSPIFIVILVVAPLVVISEEDVQPGVDPAEVIVLEVFNENVITAETAGESETLLIDSAYNKEEKLELLENNQTEEVKTKDSLLDTANDNLETVPVVTFDNDTLEEELANDEEFEVETEIEDESGFFDTLSDLFSSRDEPAEVLSQRTFSKKLNVSKEALHSCEVKDFVVDISGKKNATTKVKLNREDSVVYVLEVGSLPQGINVTFSKSKEHYFTQSSEDSYVDIVIENQTGSQSGSFTVPIFYTKQEGVNVTTVCSINIVNI